jgi:hypothetical protein
LLLAAERRLDRFCLELRELLVGVVIEVILLLESPQHGLAS